MAGFIAHAEGKPEKTRAAFLAARQNYDALLRDRPDEPSLLAELALIDAGLGRKEDALREIGRALELRPISRDAVEGPELSIDLAVVYAWIGERDRAIEQLSSLARLPNGPSFGDLKLDPAWDSLRHDPRFAQILADAATP